MTAQRVLIAYGTKNGSTAEIAEWMAGELRDQGFDTEVRPASAVRDVAAYDAVVLGAGLYAGRWQREAAGFARRHREALRQRPVWLFSSGPLDASAAEHDIPPARGVARVIDRVDARDHVTFGGRLTEDAQGFVARQIVKRGRGGDFRDREQIRAWAHGIANRLSESAQRTDHS